MSPEDRVEYLCLFPGNEEPQVKTSTRETAEMWATRYKDRTGDEVRLIRRTWSKVDTPIEIREQRV